MINVKPQNKPVITLKKKLNADFLFSMMFNGQVLDIYYNRDSFYNYWPELSAKDYFRHRGSLAIKYVKLKKNNQPMSVTNYIFNYGYSNQSKLLKEITRKVKKYFENN